MAFTVAGKWVGSATLSSGRANLPYRAPAGRTGQVAASYAGDADFTGSSASVTRTDPSITATRTSASAKTYYGWYRSPVTIAVHCTTHGAALAYPCPAPVRLSRNGAAQSITATNGGAAVAVRGINIDRTVPTVQIAGVRNGAVYGAIVPKARCYGRDALSGIARCTLVTHVRGDITHYTVRAFDKARNVASSSDSYRVLAIYLQGAAYRGGAFTVRIGHTYTLVAHATSRPIYYDAATYLQIPTKRDNGFRAAGYRRWALGITMTRGLHSHYYWNLGIKIGRILHTLKIRVI